MKNYTKPLRLTLSGLMSLSLALLLASCVTMPMPPAELFQHQPVTEPKPGPLTNGDIAQLAVDRAFDTDKGNLRLDALHAWYEGYCAAKGWLCKLRKEEK